MASRTPTEMEERVAATVAADMGADWTQYVGTARKAIRAMREPTAEMRLRAASASGDVNSYAIHKLDRAVWIAMIDSASPPDQT